MPTDVWREGSVYGGPGFLHAFCLCVRVVCVLKVLVIPPNTNLGARELLEALELADLL